MGIFVSKVTDISDIAVSRVSRPSDTAIAQLKKAFGPRKPYTSQFDVFHSYCGRARSLQVQQ